MRTPNNLNPHDVEHTDEIHVELEETIAFFQDFACTQFNHDPQQLVTWLTEQLIKSPPPELPSLVEWLDMILSDLSAAESPEFLRGFLYGLASIMSNGAYGSLTTTVAQRLLLAGVDHATGRMY